MNIFSLRQIGAAVAVTVALAATVNASAPAGRYTYTAISVTVVDTKTGLTWQRAFAAPMSWANAKLYCASASTSTTLGSPGWRLPTMKELQSLVDYPRTTNPAIDQTAFRRRQSITSGLRPLGSAARRTACGSSHSTMAPRAGSTPQPIAGTWPMFGVRAEDGQLRRWRLR